MAESSSGLKKKLTISPCKQDGGNVSVDSSKPAFEVLINPSDYKHSFAIKYDTAQALGAPAVEAKFSAMREETVTINNLILDGTGIVGTTDVKTLVKRLSDVIYKYDGTKHESNRVRLLWGSLIFFGRAKSMEVSYTLFKPSGEPLRAKVNLSFIGWSSADETMLRANRSSPDLTHVVEVVAGDTLPLISYRVYKDCSYYAEIARFNDITNFRDLKPGTRLKLPPLG